jgi:hypothetical protein
MLKIRRSAAAVPAKAKSKANTETMKEDAPVVVALASVAAS